MATLTVSPQSARVGGAGLVALLGGSTSWVGKTASTLFTVSGGTSPSISAVTILTNTTATATLARGSTLGTLALTDTSTGATATFYVKRRALRWFPQIQRRWWEE